MSSLEIKETSIYHVPLKSRYLVLKCHLFLFFLHDRALNKLSQKKELNKISISLVDASKWPFFPSSRLGNSSVALSHGRFVGLISYCSPSISVSKRVRTVSGSIELTKEVMEQTCPGFIVLCKPDNQLLLSVVLSVFPLSPGKEDSPTAR